MSLSIDQARTAPALYREQFKRMAWPQQYAHVRSLDLAGLRLHGDAVGEPVPCSLGLTLGPDLRPEQYEFTLGYNTRHCPIEPDDPGARWLRDNLARAHEAHARLVGSSIVLPQLNRHHALEHLLRDALPALHWHPRRLWFNSRGYSDRGEPPEPSTSLQIHGVLRLADLPPGVTAFQSTIADLTPTDAPLWRAHIESLAHRLGLTVELVE